jgi:hypothetical protein
MDKYTKGILTVIAVGIIGLNVQMMNGGGFITKANAFNSNLTKVQICDVTACAKIGFDETLDVEVID